MNTLFILVLIDGKYGDSSNLQFNLAIFTPSTISFALCYPLSLRHLKFTELYGTAILAPFVIATQTYRILGCFDQIENFEKIRLQMGFMIIFYWIYLGLLTTQFWQHFLLRIF